MTELLKKIIELYDVSKNVDENEITNLKTFKTNYYGTGNVYSFDYKNNRYYVVDDYSLMDNPNYIRNVLEEINPNLSGEPLKNPTPQSDGAIYACGIDGTEYYLWQVKN